MTFFNPMSHFILDHELWEEEVSDHYCSNHKGCSNCGDGLVFNQVSCQKKCELDKECVGISYSYTRGFTNWCFICVRENLTPYGNKFGFYRRKGKNYSNIYFKRHI